MRSTVAMSLVTWPPPSGSTAVWTIAPSAKIAMSQVPPPMSISATPSSRSSSSRTAAAEASGSSTMSATWRPQRLAHFTTFCADVTAVVTMWTLASSRTPAMPSGSRMPS